MASVAEHRIQPMSPKPVMVVPLAVVLGLSLAACGAAPVRPSAARAGRSTLARAPSTSTSTSAAPTTSTTATTSAPPTAAAAPSSPAACSTNVASQLASTGQAAQVIVVEAPDYDTTYATLTAWGREGNCWVGEFGPWTARIGRNGFSDHRSEGDGTTPTGAYGIGAVMYGIDANPGVQYSYHQLVCGDWWDEDPSSPEYNTFQYVPCGQTPSFGGTARLSGRRRRPTRASPSSTTTPPRSSRGLARGSSFTSMTAGPPSGV